MDFFCVRTFILYSTSVMLDVLYIFLYHVHMKVNKDSQRTSSVSMFSLLFFFVVFNFCRFCVVIRFSSTPQLPMTSDFEEFSIPYFIHYIYCPILNLEKEPEFPFLMFSAKQGNYWYHFYNVFGMTRSLTGDWNRDLPHSKPALYH